MEDRQPAGRLDRRLERDDDLLAGRLDRGRRDLGDRPTVDGRLAAVEQAGPLEQLAHDQGHAARLVHVGRGVAAARLHVGDDRRPVGDGAELVDVERDAVLVRDGEQVQDAVGRAAGRGDAGDPVLERLPGDDRGGPDVPPDEIHHELAGREGGVVLARILGRDAVQAGRRQPDELQDHAHRVGRELAAAGAGARAGRVLDLVQLVERDLARPDRHRSPRRRSRPCALRTPLMTPG